MWYHKFPKKLFPKSSEFHIRTWFPNMVMFPSKFYIGACYPYMVMSSKYISNVFQIWPWFPNMVIHVLKKTFNYQIWARFPNMGMVFIYGDNFQIWLYLKNRSITKYGHVFSKYWHVFQIWSNRQITKHTLFFVLVIFILLSISIIRTS